jgi:hypothetical protein
MNPAAGVYLGEKRPAGLDSGFYLETVGPPSGAPPGGWGGGGLLA